MRRFYVFKYVKPLFYCIVPCDHDQERGGGFKTVSPFFHRAWSYDPICPSARRLGAGGALTVLQFAQLFGCTRVLGLNMDLERVLGSSTQRCVLANQNQQA
jgi:hypothetical protein